MLDASSHTDRHRADALVDEVLHDLELIQRIGVDRPTVDEFHPQRFRGFLAASLHGVEVRDANELRHEGDGVVLVG